MRQFFFFLDFISMLDLSIQLAKHIKLKTWPIFHSGSQTQLGNLTYVPLRDGPTLWEIGYPDRTAIDYYVPDVNPMYVNKLFVNSPEK